MWLCYFKKKIVYSISSLKQEESSLSLAYISEIFFATLLI